MANIFSSWALWKLLRVLYFLLIIPVVLGGIDAPIYRERDFIAHIPDSPHFVMFFAPWCSHCERLFPLWNNLAKQLGKPSSPVTVAKVDCTLDTPLCAQEDIKAYPTMRLFSQGKKITYRGQRDLSEIARFVLKELENLREGLPSGGQLEVELDTYSFGKEIQHGLKIVNFYVPWCTHCQRLSPTWQKLADKFKHLTNVKILKVNCERDKLTCKKYKIRSYPRITAFFQGQEERQYQGDRSFESLKDFVEEMMKEHLSPFNALNEEDSISNSWDLEKELSPQSPESPESRREPIAVEAPDAADDEVINLRKDIFDLTVANGKTFIYFYAPWCKHCKLFSPIWDEFARRVVEKGIMVKVAKVDCTTEQEICSKLKVTSYPTVRLFRSRLNYVEYNGERTTEGLLSFIRQHERDEL